MKLSHALTDAQAHAIVQLFPRVQTHGDQALSRGVDILLEQEAQRRGTPDPVSGAVPVAALLQGSLLQREFDAGLHSEESGWLVGAVMVDVQGMILQNMRLGFARGDALLGAVAQALARGLAGTTVVRLHGDAFAALFLPTSGRVVEVGDLERAREAVLAAVQPFNGGSEEPHGEIRLTVAGLALRIVQPAHWQVLGPLVWSEAERALLLEKLGRASGVQERAIVLGGAIPGAPVMTRGE